MVGAGGVSEDLGNIISDLIRFLVQADTMRIWSGLAPSSIAIMI